MGNRILSSESYDAIEEYKETSFIANMIINDARRSAYGEHGYIMCGCTDGTLPYVDDDEFFRLAVLASRRESFRDGCMRMGRFSARDFGSRMHAALGMVVLHAKYGNGALDSLLAYDDDRIYDIMKKCEGMTYQQDITTGYAAVMEIFRKWEASPRTREFFNDMIIDALIWNDIDDMIGLWNAMDTSYPDINGVIMAYVVLSNYHNGEKNSSLGSSICHVFFFIFERCGDEIEEHLAYQSCSTLIHLYNVVKANDEENAKRALPEASRDIIASMKRSFVGMEECSYEFGFEMLRDCI
jgi:hypothetical protein